MNDDETASQDGEARHLGGNTFSGPTAQTIGDNNIQNIVFQQTPRTPADWPCQVGVIPPRAQPFQHRQEIGHLRTALESGGTAVLCPAPGQSGAMGKTQLAAEYARSAREDVLIWIAASTRAEVLENYARAAARLLPTDTDDREQAARELLAWLEPKADAPCRWLVVLDGVTAPDDLRDLWPPASATGRVIATTRCSGPLLDRGDWHLVPVGPYSPGEACAYLAAALAARGRCEPTDELAGLADDLQHMPSALAQAAADLLGAGLSCADYRRQLAEEATATAEAANPAVGDWNRRRSLLRRSPLRRAVTLLTRPLRWRRRSSDSDRRRQLMLKKVRRRADDIASLVENFYIDPTFLLIRDPATPQSKGSRRRRRKAAEPAWERCGVTSLRELYDRAGEDLVLLSRPGMGKTVQLSRLARDLAAQALDEARTAGGTQRSPIPVLLSLSSYRGEPFQEWLLAEINRSYDVARPLIADWLAADALLPLLDGLDQVPEEHRRECAAQIRHFRGRCTGVVVTCRDRDRDLARHLMAACCAQLEPPNRSQVHRYLNSGGDAMVDVRAALEADPSLWKLLQSPLMLSIVRRTYAHVSAAELRQPGTVEQRRGRIFDAYLSRMLDYRPTRYPDRLTLQWLTWLARTLTERGEDVVYLDRLNESWVDEEARRLTRYGPSTVFASASVAAALLWLVLANAVGGAPLDLHQAAISALGLVAMTVVALLLSPLPRQAYASALGGMAAMPSLTDKSALPLQYPASVMFFASAWAAFAGKEVALTSGYGPVEELRWSWRIRLRSGLLSGSATKARRIAAFPSGLMLGLLIVAALALFSSKAPGELASWAMTLGGDVVILGLSLLEGFQPDLRERRDRPNEGMQRSLRHAIAHGALYTTVAWTCMGFLLAWTLRSVVTMQQAWLIAGLLAVQLGVTQAYRYGGLAILHHWAIRLCLAREGHIPLRYQRFLHDAEQRILLHRIGSGFAFPHRLLQEHLNTLTDKLDVLESGEGI